jgi:uncharacterized protein (TIGR02271 family)
MAIRDSDVPQSSSAYSNSTTIAGLFHNDNAAESALQELQTAGFSQDEVGIATSRVNGEVSESSPHESFWDKVAHLFGKSTHRESPAEVEQSLEDRGFAQQQSEYFNRSLDEGDILITVRANGGDRAQHAARILREYGAEIVDDSGFANRASASTASSASTADEQRIQLISEVLRVRKDRVQRGEVRLRKEVVTETQNIEVPVTREELVVERVPVENRDAGAAQVGSGEKEIRVPLTEERVNVEKKPVVTEEVRVGKRQVQDTKRVADTVQHEELRSDQDGDVQPEELSRLNEKKRRTA